MSASPPPRQYSAAAHRAIADAIEWEELPSLVRRLHRTAQAKGPNPVVDPARPWGDTAAGDIDAGPVSQPFVELVDGLATREVVEPDVFRHFFGPDAE